LHEINSVCLSKFKKAEAKVEHVLEATYGIEHIVENLGYNFESTRWTPPSTRKAATFKYEHVYKHGEAEMNKVNLCNKSADDLGAGVALYFQFIKSFGICLFIMSILSLPSLLFYFEGSRMPSANKDMLGIYMFSLGNFGVILENITANGNTTLILSSLGDYKVSLVAAADTITALEFIQCFVFFATVYHLKRSVEYFRKRGEEAERGECTLGDFPVVIRDIPPDTTIQEIINHFSGLYQLAKPDWSGRPPLYEAEPVKHSDSTGQAETVGTWVAEVVVHHKIGHLIRGFRQKQELMEKLYRHRAEMKMYGQDTALSKGGSISRYKIAETKMLGVAAEIDKLTAKLANETTNRKVGKKKMKAARIAAAEAAAAKEKALQAKLKETEEKKKKKNQAKVYVTSDDVPLSEGGKSSDTSATDATKVSSIAENDCKIGK